MPLTRLASSSPHAQRACLRCGYRGDELQRLGERAAYLCPGCGQDLYARPPRSYAEMEDIPVAASIPAAAKSPRVARGRAAPDAWWKRLWARLLLMLGLRRRPTPEVETHPGVGVRARRPRSRSRG
jgi:hypothetical protein